MRADTAFQQDTAVHCADAHKGRYTATITERFFMRRGPNGGYLLAIAARALRQHVDPDGKRHLRRLTAHYHRTPTAGPISIYAHLTAAGKCVVKADAIVEQVIEDQPRHIMSVMATLASPDLQLLAEEDDVAAPNAGAPPALDAPAIPQEHYRPDGSSWLKIGHDMPPLHKHMQIAPIFGPDYGMQGRNGDRASTCGWLFLPEQPIDELAVLLLADAWQPASFGLVDVPAQAPTDQLSVNVRPMPREGIPPQPVLAYHQARAFQAGFVEEIGGLFLADGRPIATVEQSALLLPAR